MNNVSIVLLTMCMHGVTVVINAIDRAHTRHIMVTKTRTMVIYPVCALHTVNYLRPMSDTQ